jgi:hypothetical protein
MMTDVKLYGTKCCCIETHRGLPNGEWYSHR